MSKILVYGGGNNTSNKDRNTKKRDKVLGKGSSGSISEEEIEFQEGDITRTTVNEISGINFSKKIKQILVRDMATTVVVKLLGNNLAYYIIHNRIFSLYKPSHLFHLMDVENNYFLFKFQNKEDYEKYYYSLDSTTWTARGPLQMSNPGRNKRINLCPFDRSVMGYGGDKEKTTVALLDKEKSVDVPNREEVPDLIPYVDSSGVENGVIDGQSSPSKVGQVANIGPKEVHSVELTASIGPGLEGCHSGLKLGSSSKANVRGPSNLLKDCVMTVESRVLNSHFNLTFEGSIESTMKINPSILDLGRHSTVSSKENVIPNSLKDLENVTSEIGCASSKFPHIFRQYNREFKHDIVGLLDMRVSGGKKRKYLWGKLKMAIAGNGSSWMEIVDFNAHLSPCEEKGGQVSESRCSLFGDLMEHVELNDLAFKGENFGLMRNLPSSSFPKLEDGEFQFLSKPVSDEEIQFVLLDMGPLKAPGSDGFHALLFQSQWDRVGASIYAWVKKIFERESVDLDLNNTLIVLIPKVQNPENFSQFRPINLCLVLYKLGMKVVANRFKVIFPKIIG
ncbi:hypothetical protein Goklo_028477 [Gossypium klotzschianum]|uniref:DUF4283 domain-containing protein n=1 Tax=Gossypium klotzschianum TaxID=34286 RepID=A0A7J8U1D6_9ROSI|nr:hypothetical protein [Gossypium klotzschianum]